MGVGGAGAYRNLVILLGSLRCIKKLNRSARAAPPIKKLIRNQEEIINMRLRYIKLEIFPLNSLFMYKTGWQYITMQFHIYLKNNGYKNVTAW